LQRITRSNNYALTLKQRLSSLSIESLPPWQTYDGFLTRNLSRHFEHIGAVGERFMDLQSRLRRLASSAAVEDLDVQQHQVVDLQVVGEVLTVIAFSYYVGHAITDVIELSFVGVLHQAHDLFGLPHYADEEEQSKQWERLASAVGFGIALALGIVGVLLFHLLAPLRRS
jgi:hypothetical protein